jgi:hypothetical protein
MNVINAARVVRLRRVEPVTTRRGGVLAAVRVMAVMAMTVTAASAISSGGAPRLYAYAAEAAESARLTKAKDLISEDQWIAAIAELRAAVADPKEPGKDEALFWLAHSQNQVGDFVEAVESIWRLNRQHTKSRWSAPAHSLLIELAQKLGRQDVLWRLAPPPPPAPPAPGTAPRAVARSPRRGAVLPPAPPPAPTATTPPPPPPPGEPPTPWIAESYLQDADLRIQALALLIPTDAHKAIPMLGTIALERDDPNAARRAVSALALSRHPEAQLMVIQVAKTGPEPVRVAAVRELGRLGGADISKELLQVYAAANGVRVKQEVVNSLGLRHDTNALLSIARSERNGEVLERAFIALGRAGGREHLRMLYAKAPVEARYAIVRGLVTARDEDGLIRIAQQEKEPRLRIYVRDRLRLMGTPRAKEYLQKVK